MLKQWAYIQLLAAFVLPISAQDIFLTPAEATSTAVGLFAGDPLASAGSGSLVGPVGASHVIRVSASKYYVFGVGSTDTLMIYEGTFPALSVTKRLNLPQGPTVAALSPDGRRVVALAAGTSYLFDALTDINLSPNGINVGGPPTALAFSLDGRKAFVITPDGQRISGIDIESGVVININSVPNNASDVGAAPNNFVYVVAGSQLLEFDSRSLSRTNTIELPSPGSKIAFTPDGRSALITGQSSGTTSLMLVDLRTRTIASAAPLANGSPITEIVGTASGAAYAYSGQTGTAYRISFTPGEATAPVLQATPITNAGTVRDIASSSEVDARYVYVLGTAGLFRIDTQTNAVAGPVITASQGRLFVTSAPVATGATTITAFNVTQALSAGQTSQPLIIRVTDALGRPVGNLPVTLISSNADVTFAPATITTSNLGYAVTYANLPSSLLNGIVNIQASVAGVSAPAAFTLTVGSGGGNPGGPGNPGNPGNPGTTDRMVPLRGQGMVLSQQENSGFREPLSVLVRDAAGQPLAGATVTWAVVANPDGTTGPGSVIGNTTTTNEDGIAEINVFSGSVFGAPYAITTVRATSGLDAVDFTFITIPNLGNNTAGFLNAFTRQSNSFPLEGRAGQRLENAIQYDVVASSGARLPGVGIRIDNPPVDADGNPVVQCAGIVQLSGPEGVASCDLVVGNVTGEYRFNINVGGGAKIETYTIRIAAGAASAVAIVQGNNQTGNAGTALPTALIAEVRDAQGAPLPGVQVSWEVLPATAASLVNASTTTDAQGRASANLTLGQTPGTAQVRVRAGTNASATFNLTINSLVPINSRLDLVGGASQPAVFVNQQFTQPIQVRLVNVQGSSVTPVANSPITFSVQSGSVPATLSASTVTTDAQGNAAVTVTAGATAGQVIIRASSGTLSQTFTLQVNPLGPVFTAANILNAGGYTPGISPGAIAVINVSGIAPNVRGSVTPSNLVGPLPTRLNDVEVLFNNTPAPIFAVSNINGQESVIVQVPYEVSPGTVSVTVRLASGVSTTVQGVQILPVKPGIFEFVDPGLGRRYAVVTRPDGSLVSSANPARRGEIVRVYVTGLGQTTPATGTNRVGVEGQTVATQLLVGLNNSGVRVVSAETVEGSVGVYTVAFEVPGDTQTGFDRPLAIAIINPDGNLGVFSNSTSISVQ